MDTYTLDDNHQFMDAGFVPSIKCVLIGDYEVGKTSLINAFATREPLNQYFPGLTGPIQIHIEHLFRLYLLHIHDTEGTHAPSTETTPVVTPSSKEQGSPLRNLSDISNSEGDESSSGARSQSQKWINRRIEYGLADVILICFSLADRTSFENVEIVWVKEIRRLCPHVPFIVIGCKLDLRRPDPTTPAPILAPRPQPSSKHMIRRPKPVRTSTASTTGSTTSPSSSEFGHHRHDSSSVSMNTRPPAGGHISTHSILTSGTTASFDHEQSPSAPSSDLEHSNRKLKPSSSFSINFPAVKAFRRKSAAAGSAALTTPTSPSRSRNPPSSYHTPPAAQRTLATTNVTPDEAPRRATAADGTPGPPASSTTNTGTLSSPSSPKSLRHVSLPPMLRSLSQVTVFRKVISRPRSKSRHEFHNESSDASFPSPHDPVNTNAAVASVPVRPSLVHRHTSGSATETSARQPHTHVRTTSQPTPVVLSDHQKQQQQQETQPAATTSTHSIEPTSPARRRTTRIEEPPISRRPRTTTYQEARNAARRLGASGYMECSALTLVNVVKIFDEAVHIAVERRNASASSLHGRGRRGNRNEECVTF